MMWMFFMAEGALILLSRFESFSTMVRRAFIKKNNNHCRNSSCVLLCHKLLEETSTCDVIAAAFQTVRDILASFRAVSRRRATTSMEVG